MEAEKQNAFFMKFMQLKITNTKSYSLREIIVSIFVLLLLIWNFYDRKFSHLLRQTDKLEKVSLSRKSLGIT